MPQTQTNPEVKTVEPSGTEIAVVFSESHPHCWVINLGDSDLYASARPNIVPDADGVYLIPAGGRERITPESGNTIYVYGTGKAMIRGENDRDCPSFRRAGKGGDGSAGSSILPHSEGLAAYFDYSKNVYETDWTDIVSGLQINADMLLNSDSVSIAPSQSIGAPINLDLTDAFTIYVIFKLTQNTNDWWSVCANYGVTPQFNLCAHNGYIAIGAGETSGAYTSTISATNYHICAMTFLNGMGCLYIDGMKKHESYYYHSPVTAKYLLCDGSNLKAMAFFDNVAQSPTFIAENTNYLAQKYGIEI